MRSTVAALAAAGCALAAAAPASAHDGFPCGAPYHAAWSSKPVQKCDLSNPYARDQIPVYRTPVAHARGAALPARLGYLQGVANQSFVCQRRFPAAEYYHPKGWRNVWWAYTKSDDHKWGWVPEVFFRGGDNDEADAGLRACGASDPGAPVVTPPKPPASSCAAYYIMGVRGSGQSLSGPYDMGSTVGLIAQAAVAQLHGDRPAAVVKTWSVPYPASPIGKIISWDPNQFGVSMAKGQRMLSARIRSVVAKCPGTRIGVFGYSQGAGVASRTMRALPTSVLSHIRMVTLFADTDSYGNTPYSVTYNYANRQYVPAGRWGHGIFAKRKLPAALPHKLDFCFIQDPVCSMPSNPILKAMVIKTAKDHTRYWDFVADDGQRLVTVAGQESARAMEE